MKIGRIFAALIITPCAVFMDYLIGFFLYLQIFTVFPQVNSTKGPSASSCSTSREGHPILTEIRICPISDACVFLVLVPLNQLELDLDNISYFDTFCSSFSKWLEVLHKHHLILNQQPFYLDEMINERQCQAKSKLHSKHASLSVFILSPFIFPSRMTQF